MLLPKYSYKSGCIQKQSVFQDIEKLSVSGKHGNISCDPGCGKYSIADAVTSSHHRIKYAGILRLVANGSDCFSRQFPNVVLFEKGGSPCDIADPNIQEFSHLFWSN